MHKLYTPWGVADHQKTIADGLFFVETPSHGGFAVSEELYKKMPPVLRKNSQQYNGFNWFEEDCQWCCVVISFPSFFSEEEVDMAYKTLKMWFWQDYEEFMGVTLEPGESNYKDSDLFKEKHRTMFCIHSALSIDKKNVKCYARRESDQKEIWVIVPDETYKTRMNNPSVGVTDSTTLF